MADYSGVPLEPLASSSGESDRSLEGDRHPNEDLGIISVSTEPGSLVSEPEPAPETAADDAAKPSLYLEPRLSTSQRLLVKARDIIEGSPRKSLDEDGMRATAGNIACNESNVKTYNLLRSFFRDLGLPEAASDHYAIYLSRPQYKIRKIHDLRNITAKQLIEAGVNVRLHRTTILTAFPLEGSREYGVIRVVLLLWWMVLVAVGTIYQRLLCGAGIPNDCVAIDTDAQRYNVVNTIFLLIDKAVLTFIFARVNTYKLRQIHFYVIYFGMIPLFGYLGDFYSDIYFNADSINRIASNFSARHIILIVVIVVVAGGLIVYHIYLATRLSRFYLGMYLGSLAFIAALEAALYGYISQSHDFYLHHWYAFWLLTLFTRFDDFFSVGALALCLAVFVQGASSYGAAVVPWI